MHGPGNESWFRIGQECCSWNMGLQCDLTISKAMAMTDHVTLPAEDTLLNVVCQIPLIVI